MTNSTLIKVSIFVLCSILALIWGVNFLKGKGTLRNESQYYIVYDKIDGLNESSPISLNGYKVGAVRDINFTADKTGRLLVQIGIYNNIKLPKTTTAQIFSSDLLGTKAINILLGSSEEMHSSGDTLNGDFEPSLTDELAPIKDKVESLITDLETTVKSVNSLLSEENTYSISQSIKSLNRIVNSFEKTSTNIESISSNFKNNNENITNIINNVSEFTDTLNALEIKNVIDQTNIVMKQLAETTTKLNEGEGTAGQILKNDTLYFELEAASRNLNLLLEDLRLNPSRYVQVSVFGGKDKNKEK